MHATSYRACYYQTPDGQGETRLTGPEHARCTDEELRDIAECYALLSNLASLDAEPDRVSEWTKGGAA